MAEEHEEKVMEEIEKDEAERKRKEDEKRRKAALATWRKLLMGMRIAARIKKDYGHLEDKETVDLGTNGDLDGDEEEGGFERMTEKDEEMAGGFLPEGYEEEDAVDEPRRTSGYFPVAHAEDVDDPLEIAYGEPETNTAVRQYGVKVEGIIHEFPKDEAGDNEVEEEEEEEEDKDKEQGDEEDFELVVEPRRRTVKIEAKPPPEPKPAPKVRASTRRRSTRMKIESSEEENDEEGEEDDKGDDEDFKL